MRALLERWFTLFGTGLKPLVKTNIVFEEQLRALQGMFRQSVYGGPTVYAVANSLRERYSHLLSVGRRTHAIRLWEKTGSRDSNDI